MCIIHVSAIYQPQAAVDMHLELETIMEGPGSSARNRRTMATAAPAQAAIHSVDAILRLKTLLALLLTGQFSIAISDDNIILLNSSMPSLLYIIHQEYMFCIGR